MPSSSSGDESCLVERPETATRSSGRSSWQAQSIDRAIVNAQHDVRHRSPDRRRRLSAHRRQLQGLPRSDVTSRTPATSRGRSDGFRRSTGHDFPAEDLIDTPQSLFRRGLNRSRATDRLSALGFPRQDSRLDPIVNCLNRIVSAPAIPSLWPRSTAYRDETALRGGRCVTVSMSFGERPSAYEEGVQPRRRRDHQSPRIATGDWSSRLW